MKLVICTKFHVNRINCVESRRGRDPIDLPPPKASCNYFFFEASRVTHILNYDVCMWRDTELRLTSFAVAFSYLREITTICFRNTRLITIINVIENYFIVLWFVRDMLFRDHFFCSEVFKLQILRFTNSNLRV